MTIEELVGQAIGEASMCWSEPPKGVFDASKAEEIAERLMDDIRGWAKAEFGSYEDILDDDE
jgi:hypothetical protein